MFFEVSDKVSKMERLVESKEYTLTIKHPRNNYVKMLCQFVHYADDSVFDDYREQEYAYLNYLDEGEHREIGEPTPFPTINPKLVGKIYKNANNYDTIKHDFKNPLYPYIAFHSKHSFSF